MRLCSACNGHGFVDKDICNDCGGEGVAGEVTFTRKKIIRNESLGYQDYLKKKERELNKIDKKNAREDF